MTRMLPILLFAALPLGACTPAADTPAPSEPSPVNAPQASSAAAPASAVPSSGSVEPADAPPSANGSAGATIRGAIRDGNRPPPALRICAHPVEGGMPTCMDSPAGATDYRIGVAPGRYHLLGWVRGGEPLLIAHAVQIRCIRPPCPPDELIEVEVAAGEEKTGIDLSGAYVDVPSGWPKKP